MTEIAEYYGGRMSPMQMKMAHLRSLRGGAPRKQPNSYYNCLKACRTDAYGYKPVARPEAKKLTEAKARAVALGLTYPEYQKSVKAAAAAKAKLARAAKKASMAELLAPFGDVPSNMVKGFLRKKRPARITKPKRKTQNISMTQLLKGRARMLGISPIGTNAALKERIDNHVRLLEKYGNVSPPNY